MDNTVCLDQNRCYQLERMVVMNQFFVRAFEIQEEIRANRRYLHQHAEVGVDLPETTQYLMKTLREMGYEPQEIAPCSVVATVS